MSPDGRSHRIAAFGGSDRDCPGNAIGLGSSERDFSIASSQFSQVIESTRNTYSFLAGLDEVSFGTALDVMVIGVLKLFSDREGGGHCHVTGPKTSCFVYPKWPALLRAPFEPIKFPRFSQPQKRASCGLEVATAHSKPPLYAKAT